MKIILQSKEKERVKGGEEAALPMKKNFCHHPVGNIICSSLDITGSVTTTIESSTNTCA